MNKNDYVVIMAGGGGTRLWPLSRQGRPKQMLRLLGDRSFFQMAVDRMYGLIPAEHILVVTTEDQAPGLIEQAPQIPVINFLLEPMPRGTASVVGLAAIALRQRCEDAGMIVVTADHMITNVARFHQLLKAGMQVARRNYLVTLGIQPTYPATGYGYIQLGEEIGNFDQIMVYQAKRFKEKPDPETARTFLTMGDHSWNSGMFLWRVEKILEEIQASMPELFKYLQTIEKDWNTDRRDETIHAVWPQIQPQTIDYGIMEKAKNVAVLPADNLGWSDVGSWLSLYELIHGNDQDNILLTGKAIEINATGNLAVTEDAGKLITLIGVENLVIVDTPNALLVCRKEAAEQVRTAVNQIRQLGYSEYL